jgi:hypothetical protein
MFAPNTGLKPRWGKVSKKILLELSNEIEFDLVGHRYD